MRRYGAAVSEYGLWDQVRVDHGKEFYLSLYMQERLRVGHGNDTIPYIQTTSICNHIIEIILVEIAKSKSYISSKTNSSTDG